MTPHPYSHVVTPDYETLTVFPADGDAPIVANGDHPHFAAILAGAAEAVDPYDLRALADLTTAAATHFEGLSERVAVGNGRIYFDGDEIDNALTHQIRRFLDSGVDDWVPLVRFLEKIQTNQLEHSREMLYQWLAARAFTITEDGDFVAYKGVGGDAESGYHSLNHGTAIVNGDTHVGAIPNAVGDYIEMPRSQVEHAPEVGCSTGLHVGTYDYAKAYARGAMLKVTINPRDVVSVPSGEDEKMRVCRYFVEEVIEAPETAPVVYNERTSDLSPLSDWDEIEDDGWGCGDPDCFCAEEDDDGHFDEY